ncbi:MAG TPA: hypothetical protein VH234_02595 [Candidatus Saccharimonadales bacterium]|nr:hypothetical protein [Candidatus Saccharimonadales bacterium]
MTGSPQERLSTELTPSQVDSMATPLPDFTALHDIPAFLGYNAHVRLEEILGMPVASDDARPMQVSEETGQRAGTQLGSLVGRDPDFTRNLSKIESNIGEVAEQRGVPVEQVWSEVVEVLQGSGIGKPMHRTLDRALGDSYGAISYVNQHADSGIAIIRRSNIYNWDFRREVRAMAFLGSLSTQARGNVELFINAGSGRQYKGDNELWADEVRPFIMTDGEGKRVCSLTESLAAEKLRVPHLRELLSKLGLGEEVVVDPVKVEAPKASGDDVVWAIVERHGDRLKNLLIVEIGNAPAGYTQLDTAIIIAKEIGIDPTRQYVAVTDGVEIVQPDFFQALTIQERSRVQNGATALNSFNGWLQRIVKTNEFFVARNLAAE